MVSTLCPRSQHDVGVVIDYADIMLIFLTPVHEKFADFRETYIACSSWYAEFRTFRFLKISLSVPKICDIFVFFNSACLFENIFLQRFTVLIAIVMLNSHPLEFLRYLLPLKISVKAFSFF